MMGFYHLVVDGGDERWRLDADLPFDQDTGQSLHQTPILVLVVAHCDVPSRHARKTSKIWEDFKTSRSWIGIALRESSRRVGCWCRIGRVDGGVADLGDTVFEELTNV